MSIIKLTMKTTWLKELNNTFTNAIIFKFNNSSIDILEVEKYKYSFGKLLNYEDYKMSSDILGMEENDLRRFAKIRTSSLENFVSRVKGENVIMTFNDVSLTVLDDEEPDRMGKFDLVDMISEFDPIMNPKPHAFLMSCTRYKIEGTTIYSESVKRNNNYIVLNPKSTSYDNNKIHTEYVEWQFDVVQEDEVKLKEIRTTTNTNDVNTDVWYYYIDENILDEELLKWKVHYHMNIINDHYNRKLGNKILISFVNLKPSVFFINSNDGFNIATSLKSYEPIA